MAISTDTLLERIALKGKVRFWRFLCIAAITLLAVTSITRHIDFPIGSHIARLNVNDIIEIDRYRSQAIDKVAHDDSVVAVIIEIDSPGGTAVGGESLYYSISELQKTKPVVVVMNSMATSAGYLIATPADRIFAHKATLTGSIGVILQTPNVADLAKKIGIKMQTIKTGPLKGSPSMFEDMDKNTSRVMQGLVDDFYNVFVDIITEHRRINRREVVKLADGRVYSGLQAVANGLIDEIGTEKQAISWLEKNKNIKSGLKIHDVNYGKHKSPLEKLLDISAGTSFLPKEFSLHGLLSIWKNTAI